MDDERLQKSLDDVHADMLRQAASVLELKITLVEQKISVERMLKIMEGNGRGTPQERLSVVERSLDDTDEKFAEQDKKIGKLESLAWRCVFTVVGAMGAVLLLVIAEVLRWGWATTVK